MCQNRGQAEREAAHASADAQAGVPVAQVRSLVGETGGRPKSHGVSREVSGQTHHALVITWQEEERGRTHNINKPWESVQQGKSGGRGEGPAGTGACTSRGGTGQVSGACGGGDGDRGNKGEGQAGEQRHGLVFRTVASGTARRRVGLTLERSRTASHNCTAIVTAMRNWVSSEMLL